MRWKGFPFFLFALLVVLWVSRPCLARETLPLEDGWELFSSASPDLPNKAAKLSKERFQVEEVLVDPHIRTIIGHKDGDVANDLNTLAFRIVMKDLPLLVEEELQICLEFNFNSVFGSERVERFRISFAISLGPFIPGNVTLFGFDGHKDGEGFQPALF